MKKILICLMTLALLVSSLAVLPVAAEDTVEGYTVEFSALTVVAVYNQTPVSTEPGTKVYIDYAVVSSDCPAWVCFVTAPNPQGIWPFNNAQGGGSVCYDSTTPAIIIQPGYTYHMVYEVTGEGNGYTFSGTYTDTEGNTHEWMGDSYLSEPMPSAGQTFPYGAYVGLTAFNGDSSAKFVMKITDAEGNDLGIMSNRGETLISAPNLKVTYVVGEQDVTASFHSSVYTFDPLVGLSAELLPTYTAEDGLTRVTEWYYDAELTQKCEGIAPGATENVTLYGKVAPCTYSIVFNANGGEGTMDDQTVELGATVALSANAFTCEGKTFLGWGYFQDDATATFTDGQEVSDLTNKPDGKVFLYAIWGEPETTEAPTEEATEEPTDTTVEEPTEEVTEEVTTAPETTPETQPEKSGCGATVGAAALLMAMAAAVALRKKD